MKEGIPEDRAHWAAMLRDAEWSPGVTLKPYTRMPNFNAKMPEETVLDALRNGSNSVRIQFNSSSTAGTPHSIPEPVLHALQPKRAEASVDGARAALDNLCRNGAYGMPQFLDLLVSYSAIELEAQQPWNLLCKQASRYMEHGVIGRLFSAAARAHGVYEDGDEMRKIAGAWAAKDGSTAALNLSARVYQGAGGGRHMYFTRPETTSAIFTAAESDRFDLLEHQLPSPTGIAWLDRQKNLKGRNDKSEVLAWASIDGNLAVTLATAEQIQRRTSTRGANKGMVGAALYRINGDRSAEELTKRGRTALALLSALSRLYSDNQMAVSGPAEVSGFRSRSINTDDAVVLRYNPTIKLNSWIPSESRQVHETRWVVRGHWRNQWYPSLGIHRPVWIAEHEAGAEGVDAVHRDVVYRAN